MTPIINDGENIIVVSFYSRKTDYKIYASEYSKKVFKIPVKRKSR